jgi:hypothetical protein
MLKYLHGESDITEADLVSKVMAYEIKEDAK